MLTLCLSYFITTVSTSKTHVCLKFFFSPDRCGSYSYYGCNWVWPIQCNRQRFYWKENHSCNCILLHCFHLGLRLCLLLPTFSWLGRLCTWRPFYVMQLWLFVWWLESKVVCSLRLHLQLLLSNLFGDLFLFSNSESCGGSWVGTKGSSKENECWQFALKSGKATYLTISILEPCVYFVVIH